MKRLALIACTVASFAPAAPVHAQTDEGWVIDSYDSAITINRDGSIDVTDRIAVDFGGLQKHGIFRNIPVQYDYDTLRYRVYDLTVGSVTDDKGRPRQFTTSRSGADEVIKIGDPNVLVSGKQVYVIGYHLQGALNSFNDHQELYWNVNGSEWPAPASVVTAEVSPGAALTKVACYQGPTGSQETCNAALNGLFKSTRVLGPGEQMTIVAGLPVDAVTVPPPNLQPKPVVFTLPLGLIILIAASVLLFRFWLRHGRDRAYLGVYYHGDLRESAKPVFAHVPIAVEFTPPYNLKPAQLGMVLDERADTRDVTATVIDLARRGYLQIQEVPGQNGQVTDWTFVRQKAADPQLAAFEQTLLRAIFSGGSDSVVMSSLRGTFAPTLLSTEDLITRDAVANKWFRIDPRIAGGSLIYGGIGAIIVAAILGVAVSNWTASVEAGLGLGLPIAVLGVIAMLLSRVTSERTALGSDLLQHTLGFRMYMLTAEKDRAQFAEKTNLFTDYLAYAIAFGCVQKWTNAFAGLAVSAPGWYAGAGVFNPIYFSSSLASFSSSVSDTFSYTPPRTSGGMGESGFSGGFSGGGGGGGGGGSWL